MNFIRCQVTEAGALLSARTFALPSPPALRAALAPRAGKDVVVGVRPENVREAEQATRGPSAKLELEVDLVETLGDEVVVHGHHGADSIAFKMDPHRPPEMGAKIQVVVEVDRLHLFDADTEKRIVS
jgi:multiple sugar transport system ATP-binding protein